MTAGSVGYTLPVWVCAAAKSAVQVLSGQAFAADQLLQLDPERPEQPPQSVPVVAAAPLGEGRALAVARCEGGAAMDLIRGLVVWVEVSWIPLLDGEPHSRLLLEAGEGVGVHADTRAICLSAFARALLAHNLEPLLPPGQGLRLQVIVPTGRRLAERTSNAAFGVVDGLALIGTQAAVQHSADPDQLAAARSQLAQRAAGPGFGGDLVLVLGENGLDLAPRLGLPAPLLLKAGNWVGPVLVAAAEAGVQRLLLFGYQGKLIKLAGGIFHTHHHLADGRSEVLTALAALEGLSGEPLAAVHAAPTVEQAFVELQAFDPGLAQRLRNRIASAIERRSTAYLARYGQKGLAVGAVLFDRSRAVSVAGPIGIRLMTSMQA